MLVTLIIFSSGLTVLYHTNLPHYLFLGMSIAGVIITLRFVAKYNLLLLSSSIIRCDASEDAIYLTQKDGQRIKAMPLPSSYMHPNLLLLAWKPLTQNSNTFWAQTLKLLEPARLTIFTTDNVSSIEDLRRLRVLLKFGKHNSSESTKLKKISQKAN